MKNEGVTKENMARNFAKLYRKAVYSKDACGRYMLYELSSGMIPAGADEETMIKTFEDAVGKLAGYPCSQSGVYHKLVKMKYMNKEDKDTMKRMQDEAMLSESMVYRRLREALGIVGEFMAQADCFKEVLK